VRTNSNRRSILRAAKPDTDYHLHIAEIGDASGQARELIVALDGDDQFELARSAAVAAHDEKALPPSLLVGVGYGGGYRSPLNRRARDYTPTRSADEPTETGGAEAFLSFLSGDLVPWLRAAYPLRKDGHALIGHSLGGLLVVYASGIGGGGFGRFLASSPSLWWDERSVLRNWSWPRTDAHAFVPRLYASVGTDDSRSMTGDFELWRAMLPEEVDPNPARVKSETLVGLDHYTALAPAFARGLRWLYADAC
jgi:predicted alpha/beta superfamily hydrolase